MWYWNFMYTYITKCTPKCHFSSYVQFLRNHMPAYTRHRRKCAKQRMKITKEKYSIVEDMVQTLSPNNSKEGAMQCFWSCLDNSGFRGTSQNSIRARRFWEGGKKKAKVIFFWGGVSKNIRNPASFNLALEWKGGR